MDALRPATPKDMAAALRDLAQAGGPIRTGGCFTKNLMGGPLPSAAAVLSTSALNSVIQYEPKDLTISVGAGLPWAELEALLARNGQTIPLDPPFTSAGATVGGVVAANTGGPRRRVYGMPRDVVIGMTFATLEGKLVQSGGMVVKNVAGLDMAKLMTGSYGTLAVITSVNFKLTPIPAARTFVANFSSAAEAAAARTKLLGSPLQPAAVDILNPAGAARVGENGFVLAVEACGDPAIMDRFAAGLPFARALDDGEGRAFWARIREFVPQFLAENPEGAVLRHSTTLTGVVPVLEQAAGPALCRAGNGVTWVCLSDAAKAKPTAGAVVEFAPAEFRSRAELWAGPGAEFAVMQKIKGLFDPNGQLNPGRMYGRI